jgi:lysophospholipase I
MGMRMPGWFDIVRASNPLTATKSHVSQRVLDGTAESLRENEDAEGVKLSQQYVHGLISQEISNGIPAERIVVGGFSQGGAMSILAGLTSPTKLAGIVGLSSWLLLSKNFKDLVPEANLNKDTPILMCHGDSDQLVATNLGKRSAEMLQEMGYQVKFNVYP